MLLVRVRARVLPFVLAFWVASTLLFGSLSRARAQAFSVLVRQAAPEDAALVSRIRGQTSDLPIALQSAVREALEPVLREQLATARTLAASEGARIVVWAARRDAALTLVVADLELDRVLVRELPTGDGERSAQDEAAALVVRSAIKASLAGEPLGQAERELAPEPEPVVPAPAPVAVPDPEPPKPDVKGAFMQVQLAAGGLVAWDRRANPGIAARLALLHERWEAGLRASFGLAEHLRATPARVDLSQHRIALYGGYAVLAEPAYRLTAVAAVGVNAYVSRVHARLAAFEAQSGRGVLATVALGAQAAWLPEITGRRVGLATSLLAEVYPQRLQVAYRAGGDAVQVARAARVQPVVTVEIVVPL